MQIVKASLVLLGVLLPISTPFAKGIRIVAAENFYGGVADQIVGDGGEVFSILTNPNQDPHEFSTNASTAKAVADADIVIYSGIDYDSWMDKLLGNKGQQGRVTLNVGNLINAKSGDNPHIWYDPTTMIVMAEKLAEVLSKRDSSQAEAYQERLIKFKTSLKPVFAQIEDLKTAYQGTAVTATEPVFGKMAKSLGLTTLNADFAVKMMNDTEPSASEIADFEKSLTTKSAKVLFYNSQVTNPTTGRLQKVAKQSGVPVVGVTETQPPDMTYAEWMSRQLDSVEKALSHKP